MLDYGLASSLHLVDEFGVVRSIYALVSDGMFCMFNVYDISQSVHDALS